MKRRRLRGSSVSDFDDQSGVNPMESVANLADVMLVLAVGMMLALIIAWNVDVFTNTPESQSQAATQATTDNMVEVTEETETLLESNGEDASTLEEYGLTEAGTLYQDAEGNLYRVEESGKE